jgi:hypothetical protein
VFQVIPARWSRIELDQHCPITLEPELEVVGAGFEIQVARFAVEIPCPPDKPIVEVDSSILGPDID